MFDRNSTHVFTCLLNNTRGIGRLRGQVGATMKAFEYGRTDIFHVQSSLDEALINAVTHGNGNDPMKLVLIVCQIDREQIRLQVKDEGPGFDYKLLPDPSAPENIDRARGRGVHLIRAFMDEVLYSDTGNVIIMSKKASAVPSTVPQTVAPIRDHLPPSPALTACTA